MTAAPATDRPAVGALLRWLSQLELSVRADVSQRHLSWVETGRAQPSRALVLHLTSPTASCARRRPTPTMPNSLRSPTSWWP